MVKLKISKGKMAIGGGAAVGIAQTFVFREYVDAQFGPIPIIGGYLPYPWGNWSSTGNIIIGGLVFGIAQYTKLFKGNVKSFASMYGFAALIGGIFNGIFPPAVPAARFRAAPRRAPARAAVPYRARSVAPISETGIPATKILA